jgi:hypothetical protein
MPRKEGKKFRTIHKFGKRRKSGEKMNVLQRSEPVDEPESVTTEPEPSTSSATDLGFLNYCISYGEAVAMKLCIYM